jgi:hypothetical protein
MKTWVIALLVVLTFVISGGCSSSAPQVSAALAPAGDAAGSGTRIASALSWGSPIVVDGTTPSGDDGISLAMIGGNPAVSYQIWSGGGSTPGFTVYFARANDSAGTSWGAPVATAFWPWVQDYMLCTSLCEVSGKPAIAYQSWVNGADIGGGEVHYVRAKDTVGNNWGNPVLLAPSDVDGMDYQGRGTTLRVVNGYPAVWYHDAGRHMYARALDAKGSNWGSPQDVGPYGTISIVNGYPTLRYSDGGVLYFVRAADANGDSWLDPVIIGNGSDASPIAIVEGHPALAYSDDGGALCFIRATDANGDGWGSPQTALADPTTPNYKRLEVVDGCPAITYSENPQNDRAASVHFIRALDAGGTTWPSAAVDVTVSGDDSFEKNYDLAIINGLPSIFFHSSAPGCPVYLNFVQALDPTGSAWETPEMIVDYGDRNWYATALITSESGAMVAYPDRALWNAVNFIASTGAPAPPPDPAVNVLLNTDKSAYIIEEDSTAVLTAVVTDEYGDPISGLGAGAFVTTLDGAGVFVTFSESTTSGTYTGNLDISGLSASDHTVQTTVTDTRAVSGSDSATFAMYEPGSGGTMHVGDLDANIVLANKNRWCAVFTVKIEDSSGSPVSGADVSFSVSGAESVNGQAFTGGDGTASYQTGWINGSGSFTFTVNDVTHATLTYNAADNDDPDGDSDGTSISISGP